ncbi:SusD/RagB family nutrient-binding outer membrane lipoprotein [Echinicola marina]|uniref:SusD/RagB family nutrient-binding outer membrane lipoprotein n=1 Tax=Echinicola marina TaxID=2859768 RepID=UPI001CF62036|nr:SusD/RagB family nutrient-binding outer membrane lipoprotein [Echinicola marina]UCS95284.1 SusD/RagB family nutrient-binding outer membrane lipoprotein [Echinicola marina]
MKLFKKYIYVVLAIASFSCTKDFAEINTDPSIVSEPDLKYLLTYSEDKLMTYQGTEWVWENMEHLLRYTQHVSASPYELTNNVNTRYNAFYADILPNLIEIRKQIDAMNDPAAYQNMKMVTYALEVLHGIKVTDLNGSIPYSEAGQGRYEVKFDPKYDSQEFLFDTWLERLDEVINTLSSNDGDSQESYGSADIYYQSDWTKWVKLANSLKLRIAVRLENQNPTRTAEIFQEVMNHSIGPIDSNDDQMVFTHDNYSPFGRGGDILYRSTRFGTMSIIDFLKKTNDPRLSIYFSPNDLVGNYKEVLEENNVDLPEFIDPNDPLIQFQGGPADWTVAPEIANYFSNPLVVGTERFSLMSVANQKFFSPKMDNSNGIWKDVVVSHAETCFYIAELIAKGYGNGAGTAEDWYNQGIRASIQTMNDIALSAMSTTAFDGDGLAEIDAFLSRPEVMLNGSNDLEKIYIQQYLNFLRQPNEGFVFCRRTGYPRLDSDYYAREEFNEIVPRRFWLRDPGEVNRANWQSALDEQGFTPLSQDVADLNAEKVWYDKTAPAFGMGE